MLPVMSFQKTMKMKMYHRIDVKKKTNKQTDKLTKIKFIIEMSECIASGVRELKRDKTYTVLLRSPVVWYHFGASTIFVIYSETIEHETIGMIHNNHTQKEPAKSNVKLLHFYILYDSVV